MGGAAGSGGIGSSKNENGYHHSCCSHTAEVSGMIVSRTVLIILGNEEECWLKALRQEITNMQANCYPACWYITLSVPSPSAYIIPLKGTSQRIVKA